MSWNKDKITDSPTLQDVVSLFKPRLQVSLLDGSDWLIERLGGDGFLSITPTSALFPGEFLKTSFCF